VRNANPEPEPAPEAEVQKVHSPKKKEERKELTEEEKQINIVSEALISCFILVVLQL